MNQSKFINGTVTWGIIGCGDVCEVKSGPAFNKVSNSKLVAVMRRDADKAKDFAARHGVPKFYSDAQQLIEDKEVNAIYIATPPASHEEFTVQALKAGKPVYVEKPVTMNPASCERMIEAATQYNGRVSVAHYRRRLPLFIKVKELIETNAIGRPLQIQIRVLQPSKSKIIMMAGDFWRVIPELSGGGLFQDLSPHQLDIMYWLFGAPSKTTGHGLNQLKKYNAQDFTVLNAVYANDVYLNGIWAFNLPDSETEDSCTITGESGSLRFSFFQPSKIELRNQKGVKFIEAEYPINIQQPFIDSVTKYFRNEGPNPCSLNDALVTMRMMDITKQNFI